MVLILCILALHFKHELTHNLKQRKPDNVKGPAAGGMATRKAGDDVILCVFASASAVVDGNYIGELDADVRNHDGCGRAGGRPLFSINLWIHVIS
jgi:hypothetical protein